MSVTIQFKTGTKQKLDFLASKNGLTQGEPFLLTDKNSFVVATSTNTYLTADSINNTDTIRVNSMVIPPVTINTADTTTIDSWYFNTYRSARYNIQVSQGTEYYMCQVSLIHNGIAVSVLVNSILETGTIPITFTAMMSGSTCDLNVLVTTAATTGVDILMERTLFVV